MDKAKLIFNILWASAWLLLGIMLAGVVLIGGCEEKAIVMHPIHPTITHQQGWKDVNGKRVCEHGYIAHPKDPND